MPTIKQKIKYTLKKLYPIKKIIEIKETLNNCHENANIMENNLTVLQTYLQILKKQNYSSFQNLNDKINSIYDLYYTPFAKVNHICEYEIIRLKELFAYCQNNDFIHLYKNLVKNLDDESAGMSDRILALAFTSPRKAGAGSVLIKLI